MMEGRLRPLVRMLAHYLHMAHPTLHTKSLMDK
ncbi:MAG: hypothetical protein ACI9LX_003937 [Paraglaciecola sp.]|jgi:hypothetical protein